MQKEDHFNLKKGDHFNLKKGDHYKLKCGHEGRVIWVSSNETVFGVRGSNRSCQSCGKKTSGGWVPTVYLITADIAKEDV
jgi:NMD protein affecting ribosome stability and mRNA decay